MSHDKPEPQPAVETTEPAPDTGSTDRARRREAALRRLQQTTISKRTAAALGVATVAAVAAVTAAGTIWAPTQPEMDTAAQAANLPATPVMNVCPGAPVLPEGAGEGEDLDFSPVSSDAVTALSVAAVSDLAGNIPGMSYFAAATDPSGQPDGTRITEALDEEIQQGPPATAATDGTVTQNAYYEVIADPEAELVLTSDDEATVSITPVDEDGEPGETSTQELAADTAVTFQDDDAAAYLLETGSNSVHAGVLIDSSAGVSAMPVNTVGETGSGLPVRIGY